MFVVSDFWQRDAEQIGAGSSQKCWDWRRGSRHKWELWPDGGGKIAVRMGQTLEPDPGEDRQIAGDVQSLLGRALSTLYRWETCSHWCGSACLAQDLLWIIQSLSSVPCCTFPVPLLGEDALFFLLVQTVLVLKYFFRYFLSKVASGYN